MNSPLVAMLWENWRLTRVEAAQRLGLGIVAASAALTLFDAGATVAFWILIVLYGTCVWFSTLKLNGGRFADGYKPGFPFYLLYARPVSTVVCVAVATMYDAISCAALYVVSAAVVGFTFGQPLPLFSVIPWILAFHLCYACVQWSTRSRVVQWVGSIAFSIPLFFLLENRVSSPLQVEFSLTENALMASIGLASFGLTIAGVAWQRRGGTIATGLRTAGSTGYPDWLITLFRLPCPNSSATRAQVWFELRSSGLPVLAIGLALTTLVFLLFAISIPVEVVRPFAVLAAMFSAPAVLMLGGNAFGIRRKQGRAYLSAFEATQAYGTAKMASLRVLVRTVCLLAALIMVGATIWESSSLVGAWGSWVVDSGKDAVPGLLKLRQDIGDSLSGMTAYAFVAHAVITFVSVVVMVALLAALAALRARYPRRLLVAQSLLLLSGLALILLVNGILSAHLLNAFFSATRWIAAAALVLATIYLFWSGFAERLLTVRYACSALVISAIFGAAWVAVLRPFIMLFGVATTDAVWILSSALLPLMVSVLAPWSLNRIRHT